MKGVAPQDWMRVYDGSPVAGVDGSAPYLKETSDDGGRTWEYPSKSTGEFLRLDVADALSTGCRIAMHQGVVVIESPHPIGGLIRYTPRS